MAKSGKITAGIDNDYTRAVLLGLPEAPVLSLGALVAAALAASSVPLSVLVDLENRTVKTFVSGAGLGEQGDVLASFSMVDEEKKSSPWSVFGVTFTVTEGGTPMGAPLAGLPAAVVGPVLPSMTLSSLINKIDDFIENKASKFIFGDQSEGVVQLLYGDVEIDIGENVTTFTQELPEGTTVIPAFAFE
jgi:hypothetical protein